MFVEDREHASTAPLETPKPLFEEYYLFKNFDRQRVRLLLGLRASPVDGAAGSFPLAFPAPFPILRLDFVWHSEHFEPAWAHRGDAGQSDHHPIVTGLRWTVPAARSAASMPLAASAV